MSRLERNMPPSLFSLYEEYIMRNARLDETQAGIKIAWRNINNLEYAIDTTFIAESKEELKSLLMKVKEESEKVGFPLEEIFYLLYCCCCSVSQSCLTICDPMDCSMPGCPVLHHHPELVQTQVTNTFLLGILSPFGIKDHTLSWFSSNLTEYL